MFAEIRSPAANLNRKITDFEKIHYNSMKYWSQPKMSRLSIKNVQEPRSQDPYFEKLWLINNSVKQLCEVFNTLCVHSCVVI